MAAGAAEKFVWLSKTFSGSFLRAVYPSRVQVKFKGKQKPSFYCPRWDFARKAKSRGGTLVTRAYIKESTYSWNIQSYSMMTFLLFAPASTKWLGWRKDRKSLRDRSGRFCDIYCAVILRYSFAPRVISDILWSSCFESYGPKDTR